MPEQVASGRLARLDGGLLFQKLPIGIVVIGPAGQIMAANPMAERILGPGVEHLRDWFAGGSRWQAWREDGTAYPLAQHPARVALATGRTSEHEVMGLRERGQQRTCWLRMQAVPIPADAGAGLAGVYALFEDITEQRQARIELNEARAAAERREIDERYRSHLEQLVEQRTHELAQARLVAELASQVKSDFLANVSHELRTPMNAIMGMSHLLALDGLSAQQRAQLDTLQSASRQLLGLIDDILDYTRLDSGTTHAELQVLEVGALLETAAQRLRSRAMAKGLALQVELAPAVPQRLKGDPLRIGQVLHKLLDNAVKFTEAGRIRLTAACPSQQDGSVQLRFEVCDTGIGLEPAEQQGLFQTFHQVDASATRRHGGTGLGLAIAHKLVSAMGGQIGVDSEKGRGSCFWFSLPVERADQDDALPAKPSQCQPLALDCTAGQDLPADETSSQAPPHWRELRHKLEKMLREADAACVDWWKQHADQLQSALGADYGAMAQAVQGFDFETALIELKRRP